MPKPKYIHSYARHKLAMNNFKFYHNGKRILEPVSPAIVEEYNLWNYQPFQTYLIKGRPLLDKEQMEKNRIIRSYEKLFQKTGLIISSKKPTEFLFKGAHREYYLTRPHPEIRDIEDIPREHKVYFVGNNKVKLIGPNSLGKEIIFKRNPTAGKGIYGRKGIAYEKESTYEELMQDMGYLSNQTQQVEEKIYIKNDIAVGVALEDDFKGKLVCIPEENFNPVIFICGKRRSGKTLLHYRLLGNVYHKWNKKCIDTIDIAHEAESHSLEWKQDMFINWLNKIGEKTRALPLCYLTPSTDKLEDGNISLKDEVGHRITLPFEEVVLDYKNVFRGNPNLEFEKTEIYFKNMLFDENGKPKRDGLIKCKNANEIKIFVRDYVNGIAKDWGIKSPDGVITKIIETLQYLINTRILDISLKEKAKWTVEFPDGSREKYNPWTACLIADIIPTINISDLRWSPIYPSYMKYIAEDLFKKQTGDPLFLKNNSELFYFLNEASSAVYNQITKKFTIFSDVVDMIIRESGPHRIGVVFGTQFIDQVSEFSKSQANFVFAFRQTEKGADQLMKDYDGLKGLKSDLKRVEVFECMGFPSNSPFNLYDEEGGMEVVRDEPVKMKIFPPLSAHTAPKKMGEAG